MNWTQLGASVAAILVITGVARILKLGESRISDADTAARMAEDMLTGFDAQGALVGTDGGAAIVAGSFGGHWKSVAVLKRHGAKVAARRLPPPLNIGPAVEGVTIHTGERLFGDIVLLGVIESDVRALEASLTRV